MYKGYSDGPFGQIHWRTTQQDEVGGAASDLYCLHPAPFSGIAFSNIAPYLGAGRRVIMPDYPGYGGSDQHTEKPSIDDYASAMMAVIDDLSGDRQVDLVGFHTGCLVAAELCRAAPSRIRKACLIDVPAFPEEVRAGLAAKNGAPLVLTEELDCLAGPWESGVKKRLATQPMEQAFAMFVEQIRPGPRMNAAFYAAFTYPWETRFPEAASEILVLASKSGLLEGSRKAASIFPNARLVERLDIARSVLDEAAEKTAGEIRKFIG